jgi:hypothetical protein
VQLLQGALDAQTRRTQEQAGACHAARQQAQALQEQLAHAVQQSEQNARVAVQQRNQWQQERHTLAADAAEARTRAQRAAADAEVRCQQLISSHLQEAAQLQARLTQVRCWQPQTPGRLLHARVQLSQVVTCAPALAHPPWQAEAAAAELETQLQQQQDACAAQHAAWREEAATLHTTHARELQQCQQELQAAREQAAAAAAGATALQAQCQGLQQELLAAGDARRELQAAVEASQGRLASAQAEAEEAYTCLHT